jgi:hypothetical protein
MTPRDLIDWTATQPLWISGFLAALPLLALLLGLLHVRGAGNDAPWKYFYSTLVYLACVPGMLGAVLVLYLLLFARESLLDVSLLATFGPLASMGLTLALAGRNVEFRPLPGFGRLSGLMTMLGMTFAVLFLLSRTRLFFFFGGSVATLFVLGAFVFALIKWGAYMAFRRGDQPEKDAPRAP